MYIYIKIVLLLKVKLILHLWIKFSIQNSFRYIFSRYFIENKITIRIESKKEMREKFADLKFAKRNIEERMRED